MERLDLKLLERALQLADRANVAAALAKLNELTGQVNIAVVDEQSCRVVGTMHSLCGFANLLIPKSCISKRSKIVKSLIARHKLSDWDYYSALCVRLTCLDQSIDVNEAGARAAQKVLQELGIDCYVQTRLD